MTAPCKDCKNRVVTKENGKVCEATCEAYKKFREERKIFNEQQRLQKSIHLSIVDCIWSKYNKTH